MQFIVVCPVQGGKLFFLEHVKSPREFYVVRSIQTLLNVPWRLLRSGCNLSRTTQDNIRRAGFSSVELEEFEAHELMEPTRLIWCNYTLAHRRHRHQVTHVFTPHFSSSRLHRTAVKIRSVGCSELPAAGMQSALLWYLEYLELDLFHS